MSSSSSLTLFFHPPPPLTLHHPKAHHYSLCLLRSLTFKSHIISFSSNSNASHYEREESRWLREEQRWVREEQRWVREEQRWARDRDALLCEIADLKLKIQALERQASLQGGASESDTIANIAGLLQVLKEKNRIAETGSISSPLELEELELEEKEKEVFTVSEVKKEKKTREALRQGSEGQEVRAMQEALLKLGFYSGEEDMEFSSFSSATERAVKTWQASVGAPEDGIVTEELLERLMEQRIEGVTPKEHVNGAAVTSVTEISEVRKTVVEEEGAIEVEVDHHRVFLLGENRWEEPSRLTNRNKKSGESKKMDTTTRCLTCRGEGRLLCTECDGTGEPNIEPQFLEWVDEGANCPYCEGLGYTICDVCEGKPVV